MTYKKMNVQNIRIIDKKFCGVKYYIYLCLHVHPNGLRNQSEQSIKICLKPI